jgi:hypothetical protein
VYHALVDRSVERNLLPAGLVERARALSRVDLVREIDVPLLLVRLDDPEGELAKGLAGMSTGRGSRVEPGMGFHTASSDRRLKRPITLPPPAALGPEQILVRVIRSPHYVVPLGKRAGAQRVFSERVTIGRARNSDVVLRHESVSKFHAWFARNEADAYFVVDASSRNGTWRNGTPLAGGEPARLSIGDLLRFGNVDATYCDAATLHAALHS